MNVLIIEDELRAAQKLSQLITEIDNTIHVIEILASVEQSIKWFGENNAPDLIFSDIQLADGLFFDIYKEIKITSPIIFCTAFDEYLINAFDTNAVSYLLKPITKDQVEKALIKYKSLQHVFNNQYNNKVITDLIHHLGKAKKYKSSLIANQGDKIIPIKTDDIAFIKSDNQHVTIATHNNLNYYYSSTLDNLENMLDPMLFFRANRQFIINRNAIINVERYFNRKFAVKLLNINTEAIIISKQKATEFMQWLEQ